MTRICLFASMLLVGAVTLVAADEGLQLTFDASRRAFVRMEADATTRIEVRNTATAAIAAVRAQVRLAGQSMDFSLGQLQPGERRLLSIDVATGMRPGEYELAVTATGEVASQGLGQGKGLGLGLQTTADTVRSIVITPRPIERMPVLMWGGGDPQTLTDIGFTHKLIWLQDYARVWEAGLPTQAVADDQLAKSGEMLDDLQARGLGGAVYLYPGRWVGRTEGIREDFVRVDREGGRRERENACASFPDVQDYGFNMGASVAQTFGHYPALQASLVHSEIRDATDLCFHEHDQAAYRDFAGVEIPQLATSKGGVRQASLADFPADGVIPDDHPLLRFYRWFWHNGDGWNQLHTRVHDGLKSTGRDDLWTFFDPAVRVPSLWGSGGGVDVLSQWTYSYPDPIKIGQATDELFAMAAGRLGQQVMKMTQIIWYRSRTAPELPEDEATWASWEREQPDARFITISPDHLREALWSKLSRPIRGIMYHGWGSLVPSESGSYQFTHPDTRTALTQLLRDVVVPLGPTLLQVSQDRSARVAVLESFASQIFANRGTHGWSASWEADVHLILQYAQLQPRILFDETVRRDGLDEYDVLVMPSCDVLTEDVALAIERFQARGGLIVADENVAPRIVPDILLESRIRSGHPDEDKAALQEMAGDLWRELDPYIERYGASDNPEVVLRFRQYGAADYLFAVNDHRTFGTYVGHHGRVMEQGLPSSARLSVQRDAGVVYDLVKREHVPLIPTAQGITFDADFGPGGGKLYLILDKPVIGLDLSVPAMAHLGDSVQVQVVVRDADGPVAAVVPVHLDIIDPQGRAAEFSGAYAAPDGRLRVTLDLASNDLSGPWLIRATEGASGVVAEHTLRVP
jgi:hypothetical protein